MNKLYLRQLYQLTKEAKQLRDELNTLELAFQSIKSPTLTGMPSGGVKVTIDDRLERLETLRDRYLNKITEISSRKIEVEDAMVILTPLERMVIRYRYYDGMNYWKIASAMNFSEQHIFRLHSSALKKITEK